MNQSHPFGPPRSILQRASENGLFVGLYLIGLAVLMGLGTSYGTAGMALWVCSLYLPFFLYFLLRRSYAESNFSLGIPELWAETLAMFFFGAVIQAVVIYVLLRFVAPGFISAQLDTGLETFRSLNTPEGDRFAEILEAYRKQNGDPTAVQVVSNTIVMNIFCGFIIGLIDSVIVKIRYSSADRRERLLKNIKRN